MAARRPPRELRGRAVAVTGAARGIGHATARALHRAGMKVAIGDLDAALAEAAAGELGGDAVGFALDVTDPASFEAFLAAAEEALGPLDVLVNNAGILHLGPFVEEEDDATRRQVDVNLFGVINGTRLILPRFRARGGGPPGQRRLVGGQGRPRRRSPRTRRPSTPSSASPRRCGPSTRARASTSRRHARSRQDRDDRRLRELARGEEDHARGRGRRDRRRPAHRPHRRLGPALARPHQPGHGRGCRAAAARRSLAPRHRPHHLGRRPHRPRRLRVRAPRRPTRTWPSAAGIERPHRGQAEAHPSSRFRRAASRRSSRRSTRPGPPGGSGRRRGSRGRSGCARSAAAKRSPIVTGEDRVPSPPRARASGRSSAAARRARAGPSAAPGHVRRRAGSAAGRRARRPCSRRSGRARRRPPRPRRRDRACAAPRRASQIGRSSVRSTKSRNASHASLICWRAGEQAGVEDHDAAHPLGLLDREAQADRAAPVVDDERRVAEVEVLEQCRHQLGVAVVACTSRGRSACPSARSPRRSGATQRKPASRTGGITLRQRIRPRRLAVEEDDRRPLALVDVREPQPVHLAVVGRERVVGQPLEQLVGRAVRRHASTLLSAALPAPPRSRGARPRARTSRRP